MRSVSILLLAAFAAAVQPLESQAPTPPPSAVQGLKALRSNQPAQALADFQQVLSAEPRDPVANLLAATAAVELFQGKLAVQYAENARRLDPADWKVHTTLVVAYAEAGMKAQRDQERALLLQMHRTGPSDARHATGFLVDIFPVLPAGQTHPDRVDAVEEFSPAGSFHTYYRFLVRDPGGERIWEVDVQSNDFDERSWARAHRAEAAAGERQFQIVGHGDPEQEVDYRLFSGRLDYDRIRAMIVELLQTRPLPATQPAGRP